MTLDHFTALTQSLHLQVVGAKLGLLKSFLAVLCHLLPDATTRLAYSCRQEKLSEFEMLYSNERSI